MLATIRKLCFFWESDLDWARMSATGNIFMCDVGLALGGFKIQYDLENLLKKGKNSQWILGITWPFLHLENVGCGEPMY